MKKIIVMFAFLVTLSFSVTGFSKESEPLMATIITRTLQEVDSKLLENATRIIINNDSYAQDVVLLTDKDVKQFKIYSLMPIDCEDGVFLKFDKKLYAARTFKSKKPLVLKLSFPGSMPQIGFSFAKEDGNLRKFVITESGKDGSVIVSEI